VEFGAGAEAGAVADGGVAAEAGTLCGDEEDVDAAGTLFCGSGASGSASAADSTVCATMDRVGCTAAVCVRCVCACIEVANERARAINVAEIKMGGKSGLTSLVYRTELRTNPLAAGGAGACT
jgi:hypothetical protein